MGAHDVRDRKVDALLSSFSMVFKDVYLFDDTVESDIGFGRPQAMRKEGIYRDSVGMRERTIGWGLAQA